MRIIIELDAGAAAPELQITTPGKSQTDNNSVMSAMAIPQGVKTTDAGGPKYAAADQTGQPFAAQGNQLPEGSSSGASGASGGAAPGEEM